MFWSKMQNALSKLSFFQLTIIVFFYKRFLCDGKLYDARTEWPGNKRSKELDSLWSTNGENYPQLRVKGSQRCRSDGVPGGQAVRLDQDLATLSSLETGLHYKCIWYNKYIYTLNTWIKTLSNYHISILKNQNWI